jgi:hypothetical protein
MSTSFPGGHKRKHGIRFAKRQMRNQSNKMIYTEAQNLDEALDIIAARKAKRARKKTRAGKFVERLDIALGRQKGTPISLQKFSWDKEDE